MAVKAKVITSLLLVKNIEKTNKIPLILKIKIQEGNIQFYNF